MKIFRKYGFFIATAILTGATGCKKLLTEVPREKLYPDYFATAGGVQAAVTGVYADLRNGIFAGENFEFFYSGTDEVIAGASSLTNNTILCSYNGVTPSNGPDITGLYVDINTLNGVMQYSSAITDVAARTQYVGQAKFLRGYLYYLLVQTYGGLTATQKSGIPLHTTYITKASSADAPAQLTDIYNAIIQDFTEAAAALPATITASNPFSAGGVGKTATAAVANAFLAKTYLSRGYTEAKQAGDFQKAADLTAALIANKGTYGLDLWQNYFDVHKPVNDYGKENMFAIDWGLADPTYSGYTLGGSGGYGNNALYVLQRFNYVGPGIDYIAGIDAVPQKINTAKQPMLRDVYNGRPYVRFTMNKPFTFDVAFADQVHDTRYDATFQTFWICDKAVAAGTKSDGSLKGTLTPASNVSLTLYNKPVDGDTAILMPSVDVTMTRRDAFNGLIVTPKQFSNAIFPTVKKYDDPLRTGILDFGSRPLILMRFSEVYLMNAEANYMLNNIPNVVSSLNTIRQRAAFRSPADANSIAKNAISVTAATQAAVNTANVAAMALTPAQIAQLSIPNTTTGTSLCGMDLILDEYSRELYGDPRRWYDLVRTGQLVRRVKMYNAIAAPYVQDFHARRPIPQPLINNVLSGPTYPQNNGYN